MSIQIASLTTIDQRSRSSPWSCDRSMFSARATTFVCEPDFGGDEERDSGWDPVRPLLSQDRIDHRRMSTGCIFRHQLAKQSAARNAGAVIAARDKQAGRQGFE